MLSRRQKLAVEMLAGGVTGRAVAKELSIHESTISNWRKVQEFQSELANRQAQIIGELRSRLLQGSDVAIAALVRISGQDQDLSAATAAAKALLSHARLMPESAGGLSGADLATPPVIDLTQGQQDAIQQIEQHLDGYAPESAWLDYLSQHDMLDDADCTRALVEDADFLSRTMCDFKEWQASQHADAGQE